MKILSTDYRKAIRERNAHVKWHNEQDAKYRKESETYKEVSNNYNDSLSDTFKDAIGPLFLKPFGDDLTINVRTDYNGRYEAYLKYNPDPDYDDYSFRGVPFTVKIAFTDSSESSVITAPNMESVKYLAPDDYTMLMAEIALFQRIDSIDWISILSDAKSNVPKREDYVKTERPGYLNVSSYNEKIVDAMVRQTKGEDLWVGVYAERSESFNPYRSNAKDPELYQFGWLNLISETKANYVFHWISDKNNNGLNSDISVNTVKNALASSYKLKKQYIELPSDDKVRFMSSEDLCGEDITAEESA